MPIFARYASIAPEMISPRRLVSATPEADHFHDCSAKKDRTLSHPESAATERTSARTRTAIHLTRIRRRFVFQGEHCLAEFGGWGEHASHIGRCSNRRFGQQGKKAGADRCGEGIQGSVGRGNESPAEHSRGDAARCGAGRARMHALPDPHSTFDVRRSTSDVLLRLKYFQPRCPSRGSRDKAKLVD